MRNKLYQFMQGRYGSDDLTKFSLVVAIVFMVISLFSRKLFLLDYIAILILILGYFRMFSKNISKRYEENQKFLGVKNRVLGFFRKKQSNAEQLKTYHIYKCPNCKQKIRVPRGKGKISIHCPKCNTDFIRKS